MVMGKLDSDMQKNKFGPRSYTMHKNKMDERPKHKTGNHHNPQGEGKQKPLGPLLQQLLTQHVLQRQGKQKQK